MYSEIYQDRSVAIFFSTDYMLAVSLVFQTFLMDTVVACVHEFNECSLNERGTRGVRSSRCRKLTGLTLAYVGRQAWSPVRSRRS